MRIGIDIDNTLTNVKDKLKDAAYNYAISLGKDIKMPSNFFEDINNDGKTYQDAFQFSDDELKYFLKDIQESITNAAIPRENAKEVIDKLKGLGNEIIIVTARDFEFHDDPYKLSKDWLNNNNIYFDKLIVNAREKASVCKEENIDIFIDNQLQNCLNIYNIGIKTIMLTDKVINNDNIITLNSWNEIFNYIKKQ